MEGVVQLFNPSAERMFGYRAEEVIGQDVRMLMPKSYQPLHEKGMRRYLETRQGRLIGRTAEVQGLSKDGVEFPIEIALSVLTLGPAQAGGAEPVRFLGALRDLTERNKIRSVLVQNEKLASIGLLSAGVAHEINNPLAFVGNNVVVLQRDVQGLLSLLSLYEEAKAKLEQADPALLERIVAQEDDLDFAYTRENLPRLLERTRDGVDRVNRIVQSLRGLARTDMPKVQEVSLPDLVDGNLEILRGRYKRIGVEVKQEHDANPRVPCVSTQISQVILNLLVNAFQALEDQGGEGGLITVRTRRNGETMVLEVADNGPGIAAENQSKLFDPFFTTKDVGEGTGLGLSICHNIVSGHGGTIEVESQPGEGGLLSCFSSSATHPDSSMSATKKHTLLVVDDEPDVCDSVHDLLRREFRVLKAKNAEEGLRLMRENEVHIIMTDQRMPKVTGVELLSRVRSVIPRQYACCSRATPTWNRSSRRSTRGTSSSF